MPTSIATTTPRRERDDDDDERAEAEARAARRVRRAALSAARLAGVAVAAGEAAVSEASTDSDDDAASTSSASFYDCRNGADGADADATATASSSDANNEDDDDASSGANEGDGWGGESSILLSSASEAEEPPPKVVVVVAEPREPAPPPPPPQQQSSPEESYDLTDSIDLPELYVPGAVVHLYRWRGTHRAARIDRKHAVLSDVVVSAAMLSDHGMRPYFEALGEVRAVNAATEDPPPWQPFGASETCACCHSRFTWHCTSRSETTAYREKHHCRACGALVCDPCSRHRLALPQIGLLSPRRVCDRCFYAGGVSSSSQAGGVCF